jgi:hypothetical protein
LRTTLLLAALGVVLFVSGVVPVILGANELSAVNDCQNVSHGNCFVVTGTSSAGGCYSNACAISPFFGVGTIVGIQSLASSLVEIGVVVALLGVAIGLLGVRYSRMSETKLRTPTK